MTSIRRTALGCAKVPPMARASLAARRGRIADAKCIMIRTRRSPTAAQSLFREQFAKLMDELRMLAPRVAQGSRRYLRLLCLSAAV